MGTCFLYLVLCMQLYCNFDHRGSDEDDDADEDDDNYDGNDNYRDDGDDNEDFDIFDNVVGMAK